MARGRPSHQPAVVLNKESLGQSGGGDERLSLVDRVFDMVVAEIQGGRLAAGQRLHSVRQLADACEVSRDTVARAYDKLVAHGHLESRPGSGFFVKLKGRPARSHIETSVPPLQPEWWRFQLVQPFANQASTSGIGLLPPDWLDEIALGKALRSVARASVRHLTGYTDPLGYLPLRQQLQSKLREVQIEAQVSQIMITTGATHAIHLIAMANIRTERQHVMVEDPGPFMVRDRLMAAGLEVLAVPRDPDGPNLEVLRKYCELHKPRYFFCSSVLHNPTSSHISPHKAFQLLRLAEEFNLMIVEDDTYSDLMPPGVGASMTRLASLDQLERVIYIGSFSKTIAPGLRVGYVCAHPKVIEWLLVYRTVNEISGTSINERIIYQLLSQGSYRHHCAQLRGRLDECRQPVIEQLAQLGCNVEQQNNAGMYVWATLPGGANALALSNELSKSGHLFAPADLFTRKLEHSSKMRFNVSRTLNTPALPALDKLLKKPANARS